MKFPRRKFLHLAAGAAALPAVSRIARAQTYPSRPVRLVVPYPPGGVSDLYGRLIAQWLSERLGQPFVVDNRAGANANIGTEAVVRAQPDGYTLGHASIVNTWNTTTYSKLNFNFARDLAPVATLVSGFGVLVVHPSFPAKSVPELIAYARSNPGKINMSSAGVGSSHHMYGELFKMAAEIDMLHVPYRGSGPAMTDLLAGQVHLTFEPIGTSIEHIRAGKLRALAVTTATRTGLLPDVPAMGEFVPGYEATAWQGIVAPKDTPVEIIDKLNKEINAGLADPRLKARITDTGYAAFASSPDNFGKLIADDTEKWAKVIRAANIKVE